LPGINKENAGSSGKISRIVRQVNKAAGQWIILDGAVKVQYLRYAQFLRISRTDKYAALFEIAQALILNFYGTI
jgi:hypothetical protein